MTDSLTSSSFCPELHNVVPPAILAWTHACLQSLLPKQHMLSDQASDFHMKFPLFSKDPKGITWFCLFLIASAPEMGLYSGLPPTPLWMVMPFADGNPQH